MRDSSEDPTWSEYDIGIVSIETFLTKEGAEILDLDEPGTETRLNRIIDGSGLDPTWVMEHIVGYHDGNEHIGQWQRYVRDSHWEDLVEKFTRDIQRREIINSTRAGAMQINEKHRKQQQVIFQKA